MIKNLTLLFLTLITLISCSSLERSEQKKIRHHNLTIMPIERQEGEEFFSLPQFVPHPPPSYPWESQNTKH